jgi:hypothetical protein
MKHQLTDLKKYGFTPAVFAMLAIERELGKVVRRVPDKSSCPF